MQTVEQIAADIVAREGGFVNDPHDPGGATKYGVTLATLQRLGKDLTQDGRIDVSDVKALRRKEAQEIFISHYFYEPKIDKLPKILWATVFDMYVNAGANAVRILQRLLSDMGQPLSVDGQIGPQTIAAAKIAARIAPDHLVDAYGIARRNYYYRLADLHPELRRFARRRDGGKGGWITRAEAFIASRYRLTEQQHRQRVSAWG